MYKVIIVDDEYIVRRGLRDFIEWNKLGFEVSGIFKDGKEAFEFVKTNHVDAVLTDIDMPIVNGIDLIKLMTKNHINVKTVILTGYSDFEYARQSIKYNVDDYILKPIENDNINKIFRKIKRQLDESVREENDKLKKKVKIERMSNYIKSQLITDVVMGSISKDLLIKRLNDIDLGFNSKEHGVIVVDLAIENYTQVINKWKYGKEKLNKAIINFFKGNNESYQPIDIVKEDNNITLVFILNKLCYLNTEKRLITTYINKIKSLILELTGVIINIKNLNLYKNLEEIIEKQEDIKLLFTDINNNYNKELDTDYYDRLNYLFNAINSSFIEKNCEDTCELINVLGRKTDKLSLDKIKNIYIELLKILIKNFGNINIKDNNFRKVISQSSSIHDIKIYTQNVVIALKRKLELDKVKPINLLIEQAKKFIDNNYHKDISRNQVAAHVYLNPSYFSRCFKQKTGLKFIDYLTTIRMKKACIFLLDYDNKISEVAIKVGYNSPAYFTRVFKSFMGITPNEYIRANIKDEVL